MSELAIKVGGLKDFRKGLRSVDSALPREMRTVGNDVAELLVRAVRPKVPSKSGAARASLKAASTQTAAKVAAGGPRAPHYPWLDFGGRVGRRKQTRREVIDGGRYIFPTLAEIRPQIEKAMADGIADLCRRNGIEVS